MSKHIFYIAAMTTDTSGGIFTYTIDENNQLEMISHAPISGANYMDFSTDGKLLYSTSTIGEGGAAAAYRIQPDGTLDFINQLPSNGRSTCYIKAAPGGKYLYTANYFSSNISEFKLAENGAIDKLIRNIAYTGAGPNLPRQDVPHPHYVNFTPDKKYLIVIDLGLDHIKLYSFDPEKGLTAPDTPYIYEVTPAGSGPRHLIFNQAGDRAYLINELGNTVEVLNYTDGKFEFVQIINTLPDDFTDFSKASAIRLSPDGRFLFASNRGFDSVAVYAVGDDGTLELRDIVPTGGVSPRDINLLPGGNILAAANEFSNVVTYFDFDQASGKLSKRPETTELPRPLAIFY